MCYETTCAADGCRGMSESPSHRSAGKCRKPYQCGSNFPFGGGTSYGCGAADSGMQQSPVPPGDAREYGNSISGAVDDLSGERKVAGGRYGMSAETGI